MREVLVIGIGAGDPDFVTVQAIAALNRVDVFFLVDKGHSKDELVALRRGICERFIESHGYRFVEIEDPPRDRTATAYEGAVQDWLDRRTELFETAVSSELGDDGVGAFLVWGDPTLYDGTIRILDRMTSRAEVEFEFSIVPGISAVQVLLARHRLPMNRIGEPIVITPARRISDGLPAGFDNVFVMLDSGFTAATLPDRDLDVYWGAYLGTTDEVLISGLLHEVSDEIAQTRAELRAAKGWIMDTYLLRRRPGAESGRPATED
jgi:precorrin-6A synthase